METYSCKSRVQFLFLVLCWTLALVSCNRNGGVDEYRESECLVVPVQEFVSSVKSAIDVVQEVTSVVSKFVNVFGDLRLSSAISDCLDLLDLSADELDSTLSTSQRPSAAGRNGSTGNPSYDMRTWLSGALINQDTCLDGFEGTNSIVKGLVSGGLNQITSLVHNLLVNVSPTHKPGRARRSNRPGWQWGGSRHGRKLTDRSNDEKFPNWVRSHDRKLLQANVVADVVVAADGSGNYSKIQDAISAAPEYSLKRFVIYIKKGVYTENVEIGKKKIFIMMVGDGVDATVITGDRSRDTGWTTYKSATFGVKGIGFMARDITFQNTAGPEMHQAVAFRSDSDLSVMYRCAFRGYQDTLYAHSRRQFYRECIITGTVDFIFGDGVVVFQKCQILARKGLPNQKNTITAQGRLDITEPTGFSIQFSNISGEPDLLGSLNSSETYLGRPWKNCSRTVIMQSYISDIVKPKGWLEWNGDFALDTLYYGEYMNFGPGAGLGGRVNWTGFHGINDSAVANNYTVARFILGNSWLPSTGVTYTAGLIA